MHDLTNQPNQQDDKYLHAQVFGDFETIFDCTNKSFFEGKLTKPVMSFSRNPRLRGALLVGRYTSIEGGLAHGFVVNSEYCRAIGDEGSIQLIGFLNAQLARQELGPVNKKGKRGTPGYVDGWTRKVMLAMGLLPFAEGDKDRQLGYGLSVAVEENGPLDLMCRELIVSGFRIRWHERPVASGNDDTDSDDAPEPPKPKKQTRARFECTDCGTKAWSSPKAALICSCNGRPLVCTTKKGEHNE